MKTRSLIPIAVVTTLIATAAYAARPAVTQNSNDYSGTLEPACSCDWTAGSCTASWKDLGYLGILNLVYGADIEFEAEWTEEVTLEDGTVTQVSQSAAAEVDLDDIYTCDGTTCSATAAVVLPEYPDGAEVSFLTMVKAFENGSTGPRPRNFTKDTAVCNLPE
jgi:hypothetical protein